MSNRIMVNLGEVEQFQTGMRDRSIHKRKRIRKKILKAGIERLIVDIIELMVMINKSKGEKNV